MIDGLLDRFMVARARRVLARIGGWLPESGKVLDLGCGTGHNAEAFRRSSALHVFEADVADLKLTGPAAIRWRSAEALPFDSVYFDASLLLFVLSYAEDPRRVLLELRRVTRGRLIVLQSIGSSRPWTPFVFAREVLEGSLAWDLAHLLGWVRTGREGLRVRQSFHRDELITCARECGWSLKHWEPEAGHRWIRRDLFVFEPATEAPCTSLHNPKARPAHVLASLQAPPY